MCNNSQRMAALVHCGCEFKMVQPLWKFDWQYLIKLNMYLPYNSGIPLLLIYPRELNMCFTKTLTQILIHAFFI